MAYRRWNGKLKTLKFGKDFCVLCQEMGRFGKALERRPYLTCGSTFDPSEGLKPFEISNLTLFHSSLRISGTKGNDNNNYIGADNSSQILTELIRFSHSLDRLLTAIICTYIMYQNNYKKFFTKTALANFQVHASIPGDSSPSIPN